MFGVTRGSHLCSLLKRLRTACADEHVDKTDSKKVNYYVIARGDEGRGDEGTRGRGDEGTRGRGDEGTRSLETPSLIGTYQ
ncbi:MAG: hypothetical protein CO108_09105 [Deltaproteobacteria bacterium CG_4_9_14_3_um_filter_63_12]|nr:MAG: hypothetical protein CO108_09105 [Deltaproteobacteria bacterium CG_4_9_14_3_um_filter_63_12]